MKNKPKDIDRREFLKDIGIVAVGSVLAVTEACSKGAIARDSDAQPETQKSQFPQVPTRTLGRTGEKIPTVGLGCTADFTNLHHILDGALRYGMYYWDTATNYGRTKSQLGIGQYLEKHPDLRKKLFLINKPVDLETPLPVIADFEKDVHESMERLQTDNFDVYCAVHGLAEPKQFTDELKKWGEDCKKRGLFKYMGYSAHENMAQGLQAAAKCGWIDVALVSYNFQMMHDDEYQRALDAAHKAGIGIIAIKTQRNVTIDPARIEDEADRKLAEHFLQRGFTDGQAKLKFVIDDERFTAAAVGIRDLDILVQDAAVAMDKTKLTQADRAALWEYAEATCDRYCSGCSQICNATVPDVPYVSHIMRCLMYHNSYGHYGHARDQFARIPGSVRGKLLTTDYSLAETRCPQKLPIGRVVAEAVSKLA